MGQPRQKKEIGLHAAQASSARIDNAAEVQNTPPESTASPPPVVLVVGASDSCGAAGIAADLRALSGQGCHAALALTAVTAQSGHQVSHIHGVPAAVVAAQCAQAATAFDLGAIKIGMLWSTESVQAVAHFVAAHPRVSVVLDPVLRASAGPALLETGALEALQHLLLSHVTLLTPNLPEAAMLLGAARIADAAHPAAAQALAERFQCSVLLKGGHSAGAPEDLLWHAGTLRRYRHPRLPVSVRGTGCML
ncbi:MAG: bifunctional hydroxymethylpyrimidine kinase/phosphomethylpyrimidine kinase, partial [Polyangiales bacterium]